MTVSKLLVGTYAQADQPGIVLMSLESSNGEMKAVSSVSGIDNPSFLTYDPERSIVYSVSETEDGQVYAYKLDRETGEFSFLNKRTTDGAYPCHILQSGDILIVANYGGGSISVYPIMEDGTVGEMSDHHRYSGTGARPDRQEAPHAHSVFSDRRGRYFYVSDLGLDTIHIYEIDRTTNKLLPAGECRLTPGAGPRHMAFHSVEPFAFCINELDSSISAFRVDEETGALASVGTVSTLPDGFAGANTCADIHISPCGQFLYGSNRGHDSVAIYRIDLETGSLTPAGHESVRGRSPRNFVISSDGQFLLAANQDSGNIAVFRVTGDTGRLESVEENRSVAKPVCLKFM
ncbi:lactonase family protein [Paenibacillus thermotolerans]|uniref:lactonase family protein n=1 Tax=Paenibacillus thermotolerans TaxID=3027807 RepID=UPI002368A359|nr:MULTISPECIES: lactonase family protein [unclassified Paenibacillus]